MTKQLIFIVLLLAGISYSSHAQLGKLKGLVGGKKENTEETSSDTTKTQTSEKKGSGGGVFQKVVSKISKVAGNAVAGGAGTVAETSTLTDIDVIASVGTNIYPKDLGLVVTDFLGGNWIDHGDFTMLMLASKNGFKFYRYGGTIKVNTQDLQHVSYGIHTSIENPGSGNKKITFENQTGVEGTFEIPVPANNIKLISINGQKSNVNVDFTKDVILELANFSTAPDALVRLDVLYSIIGIRTLGLVAYVKPAAKVTIPAAAFRNIETENKGINFKNSYLAISDQSLVKTLNNTGVFTQPLTATTGSNDGMWINVTNSEEITKGFQINEKISVGGNDMQVSATKKNAAYAMPLSLAKKIAVASFSIQGTTYLYESSTSKWAQTETTKTIDFPEIPEPWLDAALADMYKKFIKTTSDVISSEVLPESTIPSLPSHQNAQQFFKDEMSTADQFLRVYKNLYPIKPLTSQSNRLNGENALLSEANADGLLKVSLILQLSYEGKPAMIPHLMVEMDGPSNGGFRSQMGNTKYFTMQIDGEPYEIKNKTKFTEAEFAKIIQVDAFDVALRKALSLIKSQEESIGDYEKVWSIQK
jgi:hypothetical protein